MTATPDLVLAADFGTSAVKVGLVGADLVPRAVVQEAYPLHLPAPGHAEQDPADWWDALCRGTRRLLDADPALAPRIAALSFTAQMAGVIAADADGTALRPALVWLDKRAAPLIRPRLSRWPRAAGYNAAFLAQSVLRANGAPSLNGMDPPAKMLWIQEHEPEIHAATACYLDVKDWLIARATGIVATTADSANLTWAMDTRQGREGWSPVLSRRLGIDMAKLPPIVPGDSPVGSLTADAARDLGLAPGVPVMGGAGDVPATALGAGAVADGALHICLSTSSWIAGFFPRRVLNAFAAYATITSPFDFRPVLIATQESAGSALTWLADRFETPVGAFYGDIGDWRDDDPMFLPWLAGERVPVDDARLRGGFTGLSIGHDTNAMKRSAIEGVALNTAWAFDLVAKERGVDAAAPIPVVGGAAANAALVQCLADALNRPLKVQPTAYAGVRGAAVIAAPHLGWADSLWSAAPHDAGHSVEPDPARVATLQTRARRLAPLRRALIRHYRTQSKAAQ